MNNRKLSLAEKLGLKAPTPEEIAAAHRRYKREDARIQTAYAEQAQRECDEWCAKTGGSAAEYVEVHNWWETWREARRGV